MTFTERRCCECGEGTIKLLTKAGRRRAYKQFAALEVPAELAIPTCDHCGAEWYNDEHADAFDAAVAALHGRLLAEAQEDPSRVAKHPVRLRWSVEDAAWIAEVPSLPGCMADGRTEAEALEAAHKAIATWIEVANER